MLSFIHPQEGAVGSVCVSGLVCFADSDASGEPGTRGAGGHLLQHAHTEPDAQHGGRTPPAQKGEIMFVVYVCADPNLDKNSKDTRTW